MGWNQGYTIFEQTVIGAYDLGCLDKPLLSVLMEPYRDSDIDSGGEAGLTTEDGLGVREVVLKVWTGSFPQYPDLPEDYRQWTPEQEAANEAYHEEIGEAFDGVTKEFGW